MSRNELVLIKIVVGLTDGYDYSFILGSQERKKKFNTREVHKFYEEQNKQIAAYLKVSENP